MTGDDSDDTLRVSDPARTQRLAQALSGEARLRILELLGSGPRNLNEIAATLGLPLSTATVNVQKLEEAELVESRLAPGARGTQKICSRRYGRVVIDLPSSTAAAAPLSVELPIGQYVRAEVSPPCGICTSSERLGKKDDPRAFFYPERSAAELIWFATGFIEYHFPNAYRDDPGTGRLSLSAELCSEVPYYDNLAESDISLWINDVFLGSWRSPGDFGGRRGILSPPWWGLNKTQFGLLTTWSVSSKGTYIGEQRVSGATIGDLRLDIAQYISVRIGVKPDAERPGGMNLFGKGFGDYPQGIVMRFD